jgi:hypothetical protein
LQLSLKRKYELGLAQYYAAADSNIIIIILFMLLIYNKLSLSITEYRQLGVHISCSYRISALASCLFFVVNFGIDDTIDPVTISPSGPGIAGNTFSLMCSTKLVDPIPLPHNVSSPNFEWFFGANDSASLPSGATPTETVLKSGYIYSSTLEFSPVLNESHAGMYTCRLGAGRLINSILVSVDGTVYNYIRMYNHGNIIVSIAQ